MALCHTCPVVGWITNTELTLTLHFGSQTDVQHSFTYAVFILSFNRLVSRNPEFVSFFQRVYWSSKLCTLSTNLLVELYFVILKMSCFVFLFVCLFLFFVCLFFLFLFCVCVAWPCSFLVFFILPIAFDLFLPIKLSDLSAPVFWESFLSFGFLLVSPS